MYVYPERKQNIWGYCGSWYLPKIKTINIESFVLEEVLMPWSYKLIKVSMVCVHVTTYCVIVLGTSYIYGNIFVLFFLVILYLYYIFFLYLFFYVMAWGYLSSNV